MSDAIIMRRGGSATALKVISVTGADSLPESAQENTIAVVTIMSPAVVYAQRTEPGETDEGIVEMLPEGAIWITPDDAVHSVNLATEGSIHIGIGAVYQMEGGVWNKAEAYIYQDGTWHLVQKIKHLYNSGDQCASVSGSWKKQSGTLTVNEDSLHIKGSTGRVVTTNLIDTTGFTAIEFDIMCTSSSAKTQVGIGTSQTAFVASELGELAMADYMTVRVLVSDYQGMYYAQVYTTATSVGCYVKAVRLVG